MATMIPATINPSPTISAGSSKVSKRFTLARTSRSKTSATLVNMGSRSPDSSPTLIICNANGGNTPFSIRGSANPLPRLRLSAASSTVSAMVVLPMTSFTRVSAVSNGRPLCSKIARVRVKRAVSTLAIKSPSSGHPSKRLSQTCLTSGLAKCLVAKAAPKKPPERIAHQ